MGGRGGGPNLRHSYIAGTKKNDPSTCKGELYWPTPRIQESDVTCAFYTQKWLISIISAENLSLCNRELKSVTIAKISPLCDILGYLRVRAIASPMLRARIPVGLNFGRCSYKISRPPIWPPYRNFMRYILSNAIRKTYAYYLNTSSYGVSIFWGFPVVYAFLFYRPRASKFKKPTTDR